MRMSSLEFMLNYPNGLFFTWLSFMRLNNMEFMLNCPYSLEFMLNCPDSLTNTLQLLKQMLK